MENQRLLTDEDFIKLFTAEQKRQGVPDQYNFPEAIAGNVHYHRVLAKAQDAKTLKKMGRGNGCPKIICLCGSTRFIGVFQEHYAKLTDEGYIVLTVGRIVPKHEQESERKRNLDELHLRKIDLADEVMILNVGGYIGNSTRAEIEYAIKIGKPVKYLEGLT